MSLTLIGCLADDFLKESSTLIRQLIRHGADVNAKDDDGNTPLMYAALNSNSPEIFTLLIEAGAV